MNRLFLDPALLGRFPDEVPALWGEHWPAWAEASLDEIAVPLDYVGVNYYTRAVVEAAEVPFFGYRPVRQPQHAHTEMGWEVYAQALTDQLVRLRDRYPALPPVYITENGSSFYDPPTALTDPHPDPLRVAYLRDHLRAVRAAMDAGVDVRGYFAWSFLDNYEWSLGYARRFGLIHVDYATQKRTLKESAHVYRRIIETNGQEL